MTGKKRKKMSDTTKIIILLTLTAIFIYFIFSAINYSCEQPQGIGGFIYEQIDWVDQTISVIETNCDSGLYITTINQNGKTDGHKYLMCFTEECKGEYCKTNKYYVPIRGN